MTTTVGAFGVVSAPVQSTCLYLPSTIVPQYPQALQLMQRLAHTGDKLAPSAGRDAPRFHHECTQSTFITPTHTAYTAHACAAAAARATANAMRKYAHKRAIGSALAKLVHNQPRVVATPL